MVSRMSSWDDDVGAALAAQRRAEGANHADGVDAVAAARRATASASGPAQEAVAFRLLGDALAQTGDRIAARAALDRALLAANHLPPRHVARGQAHNSMGVLEKFRGDFDSAARHYQAALDTDAATTPAAQGALLHNLGGLAHSRRDLPLAEQYTRAALDVHTAAGGRGSPEACADLGQLGSIVSGLGRHEEALALLREAIAGFERLYGPDHLEVGIAWCTLGTALDRAGRWDEAHSSYLHGLAIREGRCGPQHPELAATLLNLSRLADRRGDRVAGRHLAQRAADNLAGQVAEDFRLLLVAHDRLAADD